MCCLSGQETMDSYQAAGDLTDVVLGGASSVSNIFPLPSTTTTSWPRGFASISTDTNVTALGEGFENPYSDTGDPLLRDRTMSVSSAEHHDEGESSAVVLQNGSNDDVGIGPTSSRGLMFSRMLQITMCDPSPIATPEGVPLVGGIEYNGDYNYANCPSLLASTMMVECGTGGMMQILSPTNPGMKRRKSQAKKVVCIPAPAISRPSSGEVVPSDLWAWRKYGQKPIKGSPYPRGYYRGSSSKGCSARKQVERSRTDLNTLVITYTTEHIHSWLTQRNSLAGSTRSTSKGGSISKSSVKSNNSHLPKPTVAKGEEQTGNSSDDNMSSSVAVPGGALGTTTSEKEEMEEVDEKQFDAEDVELIADGLKHCCRPSMMEESDRRPDYFFADLGELDADPYEPLFDQGFTGNYVSKWGNISSDGFNLLDWAYEDDGASFGEVTKKCF